MECPLFLSREILASPLKKKKESLPLKIKVVQVTYFCLTSFSMLRVMPAMKSLTFPQYTLFFIGTSKFCLRLAVLKFFHFWGCNVLNLFLSSLLNLAMPQRRVSDWVQQKAHCFISFIFFLSSSAHRQPLGDVLQKNGSVTVQKYLKRSSIFHLKSATSLKLKPFTSIIIDFHTS